MATNDSSIRAVYAHVPFCRSLCGYCDFYSVLSEEPTARRYADAIRRELDDYSKRLRFGIETIYVGGGTPTTLPADLLEKVLGDLRQLPRAAGAELEFTVEANPATVTQQIAKVLTAADVNRVSIGAQSFHKPELHVLERDHDPKQVAETVAICRSAGISNISLDLIFGIPGQSLESWRESLAAALALNPDHMSCYGLTYEPGTRLHARLLSESVARCDPDLEADMYEAAIDTLATAGLEQYEISNFAIPGRECRHNLACWLNRPYLGIGPAAAGYVDGVRYRNVADVQAYVESIQSDRSSRFEEERLPPERRARESMMLELRLRAGVDRGRFAATYGDDPVARFPAAVKKNAELGLLEVSDQSLRLTRRGLLLADAVVRDFL